MTGKEIENKFKTVPDVKKLQFNERWQLNMQDSIWLFSPRQRALLQEELEDMKET